MANNLISVRCGKQPDRDDLKWTFTTGDIRNFLNGQLRYVTQNLRVYATKKGNDPSTIPDIVVKVMPVKIGDNFIPFLVNFPDAILDKEDFDPSIPPAFRTEDVEGVRLQKPYWELIRGFMYDSIDKKDFQNASLRRQLGIHDSKLMELFRRHTVVTIDSTIVDEDESGYVFLFLDPRRIFKKMLEDPSKKKQRFRPIIKKYKKLDEESWSFEVVRKVITKNDGDDNNASLQKIIKNMMRK